MKNHIILMLILFVFASCESKIETDTVSIKERHVYVNDSLYTIKGICYHPVSKGNDKRDFGSLSRDLVLMQEAGINTIRVYEPITEKSVLDKIHAAGLKVIIGFGYNQNGKYDILSGTCLDYVKKFKNHKAILFWELGNEYNYHPEWFDGDINTWYKALNNTADLIHKNDTNHPVATAHGELPTKDVLELCNNIDVWGMNVYRWDEPKTIFPQWKVLSSKPMYLSEAGADSYMKIEKNGYAQGVNENAQSDANKKILKEISEASNVCIGVAMFSFTDGWWKAGNNLSQDVGGWAPNSSGVPYDGAPNEEYWGIVNLDRSKKKTFNTIKEAYNE